MLWFVDDETVTVVVSASLPHLLTQTDGPLGTVLATRSLAGHVLAGRRPEISHAAVVELLLFDYVVGEGHVLAGSRVLDEASVHELSTDGVRSSTYWPRTERFALSARRTPEGFIDGVSTIGARLASAPGAWLGLTAGRDSTLLAACLHRAGVSLPTFTWGWIGDEDTDAASRTARTLGWHHHILTGTRDHARDPYDHLVLQSAWHEGRERANDFIPGHINWPADEIWWLTGGGGEIGRAFYWQNAPPEVHEAPIAWLARGSLGMPRRRRRELEERLAEQFDQITRFERPREDALDVFYALQRMRKWLPQEPSNQPIQGQLAGYLEPSTVQDLLAVPVEQRRDGRFFDAALELAFPRFRAIASPRVPRPQGVRAQLGRLRARLNVTWPKALPLADGAGALLETMVHRLDGESFTRCVMGDRWWNAAIHRARRTGDLRLLWNALSIDAFADFIDRIGP